MKPSSRNWTAVTGAYGRTEFPCYQAEPVFRFLTEPNQMLYKTLTHRFGRGTVKLFWFASFM